MRSRRASPGQRIMLRTADRCDEFPSPHGFACAEDHIGYQKTITFLDRELRRSLHASGQLPTSALGQKRTFAPIRSTSSASCCIESPQESGADILRTKVPASTLLRHVSLQSCHTWPGRKAAKRSGEMPATFNASMSARNGASMGSSVSWNVPW